MSDRDRDRYDARDKPIFCGNFEYGASAKEIESLFEKYGPLERVDMKTGFAFVYMKDRRDADDAIHALDRREFGYRRRRLRVEWAKGDGEVKRREDLRRRQTAPTTTLFVVNFDTDRTRERDLEDAFGEFGRLKRVQIKRNYAFVQFEQVEQASAAIKALHQTKLNGRVISVEFVAREADGRNMSEDRSDRGGFTSRRSRSRSPVRARSRSPSYGRRSRSPVRRGRSPSRSPVRKRTPVSRSPVRRDSPPRRSRSRSRSALRDRSPVRRSSRSVSRSLSP